MQKIQKKFWKLKERGKALYIEAYRIIAASTEVILSQLGKKTEEIEIPSTAYFICLQDILNSQIKGIKEGKQNICIEASTYCYSAIISMLTFGVISD